MKEIETTEVVEFEPEEEVVDTIEIIHQGECLSLSGRSTLSFAIGRHTEAGTLHLAITDNSGKGMWSKDWATASDIQDIVLGEEGLTAKSFQGLHEGRSINTGGFVLAALRELGLVRANAENSRVHESTGETLAKAISAYFSAQDAPKSGRRKGKGAD